MSIESAQGFIERLKTDEEFFKKVTAINDAETRMAFAKESGYLFTEDEIKIVTTQLGDDDLEKVAGGYAWWVEYKFPNKPSY
jgi:predicted ribosomally synthesized peptide with nif11-like leader